MQLKSATCGPRLRSLRGGFSQFRRYVDNSNKEHSATILQSAVCRTTAEARPCPTMFYFPGLRSHEVWSREKSLDLKKDNDKHNFLKAPNVDEIFPWLKQLEKPENIQAMRKEYESLIQNGIESDYSTKDETRIGGEHKMHSGDWSWHTMISKGRIQPNFEKNCPITTTLLTKLIGNDLMKDVPFAFTFFSTLHSGSNIASHAAACNLRLRIHLPLISVSDNKYDCGMRVGSSMMSWQEGEAIVFDDAYQHEVWNHTKKNRVVLLFDVWHPGLTENERYAIQAMFNSVAKK